MTEIFPGFRILFFGFFTVRQFHVLQYLSEFLFQIWACPSFCKLSCRVCEIPKHSFFYGAFGFGYDLPHLDVVYLFRAVAVRLRFEQFTGNTHGLAEKSRL